MSNEKSFADLLEQAVTEPGAVHAAYSAFHNYSMGNQLLAWSQCAGRKLPLGPLATFPRWRELGRCVRKGEKALTLCQPVTLKRKPTEGESAADPDQPGAVFTRFVYRPHWFVLAQTDGAELPPVPLPDWNTERALSTLGITEIPFEELDGNCLGFARHREIAINPVNPMPDKTRFHEIAHIVLGHTAEAEQADSERTPRTIRELEAEAVAMLCCAALGLPGVEYSRGYIQHWYGSGQPIPERSAQQILKTADVILKAGRPAKETEQ